MKSGRVYAFTWLNRKVLVELGFTVSEIYKAFCEAFESGQIKLNWGLTEEKWFQEKPTYMKADFIRYGQFELEEWKGSWSRKRRVSGVLCRVRAQHDSLSQPPVLRRLLAMRIPWFNEFKWEVYGVDRADGEIYMKVGGKSLYVPIKALLSNRWQPIEDRMISYFEEYFKSPDRRKFLPEHCYDVLKSEEVLRFKELLNAKT